MRVIYIIEPDEERRAELAECYKREGVPLELASPEIALRTLEAIVPTYIVVPIERCSAPEYKSLFEAVKAVDPLPNILWHPRDEPD